MDSSIQDVDLANSIFEIQVCLRKAVILTQALNVGIFDAISKHGKPVTTQALAEQTGYDVDVTERMLNVLVAMKFVGKTCNNGEYFYYNAAATQRYLLKSQSPNMISTITGELSAMTPRLGILSTGLNKEFNSDLYDSLMEGKDKYFSEGNKTDMANRKKATEPKGPSPEYFMDIMDGTIVSVTKAIATSFNFGAHKKYLDLGGGSGCLAYQFLETYPNLELTVIDLPDTVALAKKRQPENTKSRLTFQAGDFFTCPLPTSDLIVLSHIIHDFGLDKVQLLLKRVYETLPPGGCFLMSEKILDEDKAGPLSSSLLDIVIMVFCDGKERSFSEYKTLLEDAGFQGVQVKYIPGFNLSDVIICFKPF